MKHIAIAAVLAAGGLLLAAPPPARAGTVPHARIIWGSNRNAYPKWVAAMPQGIHYSVRIYYDSTDPAQWPATWPDRAGTNWQLVSMRPMPGPLLHGAYDKYFRALFATAPPHSMFTIWHENANGAPGCTVGLCDPLGYPRILRDPGRFIKMQRRIEWLADGSNVRVGTIGCGPVAQAPEWYAPGLDWYGTDLYFNHRYLWHGAVSRRLVWARMSQNLAEFRQISGQRNPLYRIGESNASPDAYRAPFWRDVASWFDTHDGRRTGWIDTYWRAGKQASQGGLSGPWPPSDFTLRVLRTLILEHQ